MPKKKKKDQREIEEGRPKDLTFGDFIVIKTKKLAKQELGSSATQTCETEGRTEPHDNSLLDSAEGGGIEVSSDKPSDVYFVCRTKKGGVPVKVESRASGKKVTLIEHVLGDGKSLVHVLKNKFGTGGLFKDGTIELQGDFKVKLTKYFNENKKCLRPYGSKI